jgi:hypothetical protein
LQIFKLLLKVSDQRNGLPIEFTIEIENNLREIIFSFAKSIYVVIALD